MPLTTRPWGSASPDEAKRRQKASPRPLGCALLRPRRRPARGFPGIGAQQDFTRLFTPHAEQGPDLSVRLREKCLKQPCAIKSTKSDPPEASRLPPPSAGPQGPEPLAPGSSAPPAATPPPELIPARQAAASALCVTSDQLGLTLKKKNLNTGPQEKQGCCHKISFVIFKADIHGCPRGSVSRRKVQEQGAH